MASLLNTGFDVDSLNLAMGDIPTDASLLVVADPKTAIDAPVLNKLKQWVSKGGNMLVYGEPRKQGMLNPLLQQIGVQLENGQLVQPSANETPDQNIGYCHYPALELAEEALLISYKTLSDQKNEYRHTYNDSWQRCCTCFAK